jgi:hypothetical protein
VVTLKRHRLLRVVWSLGAVAYDDLAQLLRWKRENVKNSLTRLRRAQLVDWRRLEVATLWRLGPAALRDRAYAGAWCPPDAQVRHTVAVADVLVRLVVAEPLLPVQLAEWQGQAEIRGWHGPGEPLPDLRLALVDPAGGTHRWDVEVDMGTETRNVWARKLRTYEDHQPDRILVVAPTDRRARMLADIAVGAGAPVLAVDWRQFWSAQPQGYDVLSHRRRALRDVFPL